ncbi:hypothetical protein EJB05_49884, partial [Eragrostis curvula]
MMDPSTSVAPGPGAGAGAASPTCPTGGDGGAAAAVSAAVATASRRFQHLLDRSTPHVGRRWLGLAVVTAAYALRVWIAGGYYIVTYALGIYLLNLLIAFLSPQVDPEVAEVLGEGPALPTRATDEFRPFVRRLPEFKFWYDLILLLAWENLGMLADLLLCSISREHIAWIFEIREPQDAIWSGVREFVGSWGVQTM